MNELHVRLNILRLTISPEVSSLMTLLHEINEIVPEEESLDVESLATEYLIVDWETQILANEKSIIKSKESDGSERFQTTSLEGYDLLLWGDLKTLIEPNEEDEI
ncbi:hypothetical protein Tco_1523976 [Tanacetum coccineum]